MNLQPPSPGMLKDDSALYRFMLEIYNRTGGSASKVTDLTGLKATVQELNTLVGIKTNTSIQEQLDGKQPKT